MKDLSEDKYYLNIHHRSIAIKVNQICGAMEQIWSPGQLTGEEVIFLRLVAKIFLIKE